LRVGFVNLITKTGDLPKVPLPSSDKGNLSPSSDQDLNVVEMSRSIVALGHEVDLYISDAFLPQSRCIPGSGMRYLYNSATWSVPAPCCSIQVSKRIYVVR